MMSLSQDQTTRSDGALTVDSVLTEPAQAASAPLSVVFQPHVNEPPAGVVELNPWRYDPNVSFYGPGFYGRRTACGYALTTSLLGVAHRTLPCGTLITFRNPTTGRSITVPVVDRGPYVTGRQWDLTGGLCTALGHCWTGAIYWKYG